MSFDRQVTRTIWDGRIPVVFKLAEADLASMKKPDDFYMMVHRCNHFSLVISEVVQQFQPFATKGNDNDEFWLESNGIPLKTHYPIGVLFDLHSGAGPLPWSITVHFRNFPADKINKFSGEETVRSYFYNMLKQTEAIKFGSTKRIMSMSTLDQNQLWEGYSQHNYTKFWNINAQLVGLDDSTVKGVPFRIYLPDSSPIIQKLFPPINPSSGKPETLEGLLRDCVPQLFEGDQVPKIITHGISVPLTTPLNWLGENMSYPDNFLHLVISP